jgi:enoyl-[acyl-carrier protein] reductase I
MWDLDMNEGNDTAVPAVGTLMKGRRGLIMGVANERSLGWGIAAACAAQGAELAFTYQGEALKKRVRPLAASLGSNLLAHCEVTDDASIDATFAALAKHWDHLDFLVHAIGFADKQYLRGRYVDTPREAFAQALDISCYSFTAVARRAAAMMPSGGAMLTLTYLGAERWTPHYNVMGVAKAALEACTRYLAGELGPRGIRVNAISAGPVKTASARAIKDFSSILDCVESRAPLRRNTEPAEVADAAVFLASDLGRGVTANILFVDAGMHVMGF